MRELPRKSDTILLADDEPYNLNWAIEYLQAKGYQVQVESTVDEALKALQKHRFRAVVADLSIPHKDPKNSPARTGALQRKYPGFTVAAYARTRGHLDKQVIVYSVHDDELIEAEAARLRVTYLLKGRPRRFKEELDHVLSFDPLAHQDQE